MQSGHLNIQDTVQNIEVPKSEHTGLGRFNTGGGPSGNGTDRGGEGGRGGVEGRLESDEARKKPLRRVIRGGRGLGSERVDRLEPEEDEEFFLSRGANGCLARESI